jgi:hypothetical protein
VSRRAPLTAGFLVALRVIWGGGIHLVNREPAPVGAGAPVAARTPE